MFIFLFSNIRLAWESVRKVMKLNWPAYLGSGGPLKAVFGEHITALIEAQSISIFEPFGSMHFLGNIRQAPGSGGKSAKCSIFIVCAYKAF